MRFCVATVLSAAALLSAILHPAWAQTAQRYDPSVRAAGMGTVSNAIFWEPMSASWKNPAVLGYQRGFTYEWGRSEWTRALRYSVTGNRTALGGWGAGLLLAGRPMDRLGGTKLEGKSSTFDTPDEDVNSFAFGFNTVELAGHLASRLGHSTPDIARWGDFSFGVAFNNTKSVSSDEKPYEIELDTKDYGLLFRLTPYNSLDYAGMLPRLDDLLKPLVGGIRLDAAYGHSRHNYDEAKPTFDGDGIAATPAEYLHRGSSVRLLAGTPQVLSTWLSDHGAEWLAQSVTPFVSFAVGWDHMETILRMGFGDEDVEYTQRYKAVLSGWELTIANIFTLRRGYVDDDRTAFRGSTDGWGLGFRAGDYGWFRYDRATIPNSVQGSDMAHKGFTLNLNAVAIWQSIRT